MLPDFEERSMNINRLPAPGLCLMHNPFAVKKAKKGKKKGKKKR
jgi:hypothetical protein